MNNNKSAEGVSKIRAICVTAYHLPRTVNNPPHQKKSYLCQILEQGKETICKSLNYNQLNRPLRT